MYEYAEVNDKNEIVGTVPRYFPRVLDPHTTKKLKTGLLVLRPIRYQQKPFNAATQKLSNDEFEYTVTGLEVLKSRKIVAIPPEEAAADKRQTALTHYRQTFADAETQLAALGRIVAECLRVCDLQAGPGMQPVVSDADRKTLASIVATAKVAGF